MSNVSLERPEHVVMGLMPVQRRRKLALLLAGLAVSLGSSGPSV